MPGGERSARTSAWMRPRRVSSASSIGWWWPTCSWVPSTSCISRASWPQEASSRLSGSDAVVSSARRTTGGRSPIFSHSAGEGWRRKTWTSRPAASARRTSRWPAGSRVRPKSEMRSGRSSSAGLGSQPLARGLEPLGRARRRRGARAAAATARPARRPRAGRRSRRAPSRTPSRGGAARSGRTARRGGGRWRSGARGGRRRPRRPGAARGCASHGSCRHSPTTSSSGQTARCGSHGSASGSMPDAAATASPASRRGNGNSTFAQMPSARPGVAPRLADIRCVSQRSIPRVGTEMTSGANGSASGSASRRPSASIRASARSARWMCSKGRGCESSPNRHP